METRLDRSHARARPLRDLLRAESEVEVEHDRDALVRFELVYRLGESLPFRPGVGAVAEPGSGGFPLELYRQWPKSPPPQAVRRQSVAGSEAGGREAREGGRSRVRRRVRSRCQSRHGTNSPPCRADHARSDAGAAAGVQSSAGRRSRPRRLESEEITAGDRGCAD